MIQKYRPKMPKKLFTRHIFSANRAFTNLNPWSSVNLMVFPRLCVIKVHFSIEFQFFFFHSFQFQQKIGKIRRNGIFKIRSLSRGGVFALFVELFLVSKQMELLYKTFVIRFCYSFLSLIFCYSLFIDHFLSLFFVIQRLCSFMFLS